MQIEIMENFIFLKGKKHTRKKTQEKLVRLLCSNDKCHSRISIALT